MHRLKHYRTLHYRVTPDPGPPEAA